MVNLATQEAEAAPPWSAGIPELAYSLLSPEFGGASLLAFMDVPDESGILAGASLQAALALALADLSGSQVDPAALLAALGGQGETAAAYAASLLGRHGYAILLTPGGAARHVGECGGVYEMRRDGGLGIGDCVRVHPEISRLRSF